MHTMEYDYMYPLFLPSNCPKVDPSVLPLQFHVFFFWVELYVMVELNGLFQ